MLVSVKKVALVLGSGGARGYAHIGALQILNERGYEVTAIAGASIGALVGGLHASGGLTEYTDWVTGLSARDVRKLIDPVLPGPGLMKLERVLGRMAEILDGVLIEDLPIPYTAVATDIGASREVWFTSGPLEVAIRASVGIPGIVTPIMVNGRLLVDGGVINPVPMEPVIGADVDFTMAVSLSGPKDHREVLTPAKESAAQRPANEWLDRFTKGAAGVWDNDFVASIMTRFGRGEDADAQPPAYEPAPAGLSITDVTTMSLDTMGALITRFRLAALPPDVLVTVPGDSAKSLDFHRAEELIALGRRLTEKALDDALGESSAQRETPEIVGVVGPSTSSGN
ncbi:MAG: patatin-like phospholipase family protein [Actinobacteria bacterium]|nr:esterase [Propionicimonas sp.]MBU3976731.1 patatin-like phospholipase family protein [Actinomycetota bacterium]MBU3986826.1 patatin-like phospholipase family protein [Actinomycetota bacterium]MBU4006738.1 patatin-like phospholipase family protein [Actinomycetota bacterium]MBU4065438.1 patatin-like phospholipase family protein [Actinomycetota bacterium]